MDFQQRLDDLRVQKYKDEQSSILRAYAELGYREKVERELRAGRELLANLPEGHPDRPEAEAEIAKLAEAAKKFPDHSQESIEQAIAATQRRSRSGWDEQVASDLLALCQGYSQEALAEKITEIEPKLGCFDATQLRRIINQRKPIDKSRLELLRRAVSTMKKTAQLADRKQLNRGR